MLKMLSLHRPCLARISAGAWRSRKHCIWGICILTGVFFIYINSNSVDSSDKVGNDESQPIQRSLNFIDRPVNHAGAVRNKVSFIKHEEEDYGERIDATRDALSESHRNIPAPHKSPESSPHPDSLRAMRGKIMAKTIHYPEEDDMGDLPVLNDAPFRSPNADEMHNGNDAGYNFDAVEPYNARNFKYNYNPYGEPVYNHGNRENYIPQRRVVHFDLKGAPPKPSVYKTLFPWLKENGATTVLMEYEDMFPWTGRLSIFAASNHYTKDDIKNILTLAKDNNLEVIPLVQTFGHLEFALKHEMYSHLREVPELPQSICPSRNESFKVIKAMIDQIMDLHPTVDFLHIGCDEVFQMGECELCRMRSRDDIFLQHVSRTAKYAKTKYNVKPILWHDMLDHVSESAMKDYNLGDLVEPMVWVYAEDVYRFVQPGSWTKLSLVFPYVWSASSFKGAFVERGTVPNVRRHLDNNLNWLDVMVSEGHKFSGGFRGIVLSGWQRFDHFAVLCEVLPAALPSLAINLIATSRGYFNESVHQQLFKAMNCMQQTPKYQSGGGGLNLDSDPFLWDKFSWCFFPGALVFKLTARLDSVKRDVDAYIDKVTLSRGWITDYNRRHNFSLPTRVDEDLQNLKPLFHTVTLLIKTAKEALSEWFDEYTTAEWIELQIYPIYKRLQTLNDESESMKNVKIWPRRPFPILKELEVFGLTERPHLLPSGKFNPVDKGPVAPPRKKNVNSNGDSLKHRSSYT